MQGRVPVRYAVRFSTTGQALPMCAHENVNFANYPPLWHIIAKALLHATKHVACYIPPLDLCPFGL